MQHRPPSSPTLRLDISRQETSQGQDQAAGRARRAHERAPHSPACRRRKPYTPAPLPPTPPQQPPSTSFRRSPHSICRNLLRPIFIIYCYSITYNTSAVVGTPLQQGCLRQSLKDNELSLNNLQKQSVVDQKKKNAL